MKVLVTGGAGFIGSHLVKRLVKEGDQVTVLDDFSRGRESSLAGVSGSINLVKGDVAGPVLEGLVRGKDIVYHLAAVSQVMESVRNPALCFRTNVVGTENVAEACRKAGAGIVFTSSREVYGDAGKLPVGEDAAIMPKNPYAASKAAGEFIISSYGNSYGLGYCILRLANVYGVGDFNRVVPIFLERCLRGERLTIYGGEQILDLVHISDAVDALARAKSLCSLPINIGSGRGISVMELAGRVKKASGSASEIAREKPRREEARGFVADISLAKKVLGWEPKVEFEDGLREMVKPR